MTGSKAISDRRWERMPEAERDVQRLIGTIQDHRHLSSASIVCLGKPKAGRQGDRVNVAKIRVASERDKALVRTAGGGTGEQVTYTIEIGLDVWDLLPDRTREIVLDHELCHATEPDEFGRGGLRPHDVQEFSRLIARRGVDWDLSLQEFIRAAKTKAAEVKE